MSKAMLRRLRVTGAGRAPAEISFGSTLTFITGASNTGKSHIFECVDFALGGAVPERAFSEARGYDQVWLEIAAAETTITIRRAFDREEVAEWFVGPIARWDADQADDLPIKVDRRKPRETLGGRLLDLFGFDPGGVLVASARGRTQALSLRTLSSLFLVSEEEIITSESLVAPPGYGQTAARSGFNLMISGRAPSDGEIDSLRRTNEAREQAEHHVAILDPIIESIRADIAEANTQRGDLETEIASIDKQLGELSELVAASGDRARALLTRRNRHLADAERARVESIRAGELRTRFELLSRHYESDIQRLEFALESGHFFGQLAASFCPRCGRKLEDDGPCHPETAEFEDIERASRAEIRKLGPRIADLQKALADVKAQREQAESEEQRARKLADDLDAEIRRVANPTATQARRQVQDLASRRREVETSLLSHRELDRYLALRQEADLTVKRAVDSYRPLAEASALRSLQRHIRDTLQTWRFPVRSDVIYDSGADDIVVDGKPRAANGKGVRAVMHAAFAVGLMRHCLREDTPHPGFVVIDSPLTPFRGASNDGDDEDPELRADVHAATLRSLAAIHDCGQAIVMENIDPPPDLGEAHVYVFSGKAEQGRSGFYPARQSDGGAQVERPSLPG